MRATARAAGGLLFVMLIVSCASSAGAEDNVLSDREAEEGFVRLFNGEDLTGWDGHSDFWSVRDGVIRGQTTAEKPTRGNTFCIYRGGENGGLMRDFVVKLKFRIQNGNSGVQYRSFVKDPKRNKWRVSGYQAEIQNKPGKVGFLYDEARRGWLVNVGDIMELSRKGGKVAKTVVGKVADKDALVRDGYYKMRDWNEYTIVCRGNHILQYLNGHQTIELIDNDAEQRTLEGHLALQIHAGPPMVVEFKDIRVKYLEETCGEAVRLFNGKDLAGWTVRQGERSTWGVAGGAMTDSGRPSGYICTDADYANYVLRLQVRHLAKTNSGVLLRATELDRPWPRSIEAQCKSGSMGDIYNFGKFPMKTDRARSRGALTRKLHPSNEKPIGEWDEYEMKLCRGDLELRVNGLLQNTATECEEIAGRICLQSEGGPLEFRNIVLIPIVTDEAAGGGAASTSGAPAGAGALQKLMGTWKGGVENGARGHELTITADRIVGTIDGRRSLGEGSFTLDPSAKPWRMDATGTKGPHEGETFLGICSVQGDTLRWCVGSADDRPGRFATGGGNFLLVLKRQ